jgi:hypothetical protein
VNKIFLSLLFILDSEAIGWICNRPSVIIQNDQREEQRRTCKEK